MRRLLPLPMLLILASCGFEPRRSNPPQFNLAQCLADLDRAGIRYRRLPDKDMGNGCALRGTVQLLDIGVPVSGLGALTCQIARQLANWARSDVQGAAMARFGAPVSKIESYGTYSCRPVNGVAGARLSEHAFANAVDVAAFQLKGGRRVTVLADWTGPDPAAQGFLRDVHRSACRRFSVVLGPDANAYHNNHLHLDMGSGPYCR